MARILCNVAGGGKPLKGNAETGDVLSGKTFSNKQSNALTGSMPNNGAWSASTSGNGSVTIPAGYHNGSGTVSGAASYNKGVSDADARVNTSSASYNSGYAKGHQTFNSSGTLWAVAASKGMNVANTSQNCFQSSITITVQKQSNITVSYSCIDTTSKINDVINGQMGVIINGTNHTYGWNNRSSYSYSGMVPANGTIKFYVQCGVSDGLRMGMNYSLTVN